MKKYIFLLLTLLALLIPKQVFGVTPDAGRSACLLTDTVTAETLGMDTTTVRTVKTDTRVEILTDFLASYDSPMTDYAAVFVQKSDEYNLPDWRLLPAIAGAESTFGKHIPVGSYNAYGWAVFTGRSYGAVFKSWEDGIDTVAKGLKEGYYDKGATTIESIGHRYAASPRWAGNVKFFMDKISGVAEAKADEANLELALTI